MHHEMLHMMSSFRGNKIICSNFSLVFMCINMSVYLEFVCCLLFLTSLVLLSSASMIHINTVPLYCTDSSHVSNSLHSI
jgi:hypothetical protein